MVASIESLLQRSARTKDSLGEGQDQPRGNGQYVLSRIDRIIKSAFKRSSPALRDFGDSASL
jgi:hypothetical protein